MKICKRELKEDLILLSFLLIFFKDKIRTKESTNEREQQRLMRALCSYECH